MKILAIIQARVSSTRLPNKVLLPIVGKTMLEHQIDRLKWSKTIQKIVVATSSNNSDDAIEKLCKEINVSCFRGSLDDVLDRYYSAAIKYSPDHIVRITGDCPVIDYDVVDKVIQLHLVSEADYTSNTITPTYPDGLDIEVMNFRVLKEAWENAELASEREHVTPYIKKIAKYKKINVEHDEDLSDVRLTVDEQADYELIKFIYESLYSKNEKFNLNDIMSLLSKNLDKVKLNQDITRNEGYMKSLRDDHIISR